MLFQTRGTETASDLDYAQTYGMGASGAAMLKAAPQWIHHGCLGDLTCLGTMVTQTYRRETARDLSLPAARAASRIVWFVLTGLPAGPAARGAVTS